MAYQKDICVYLMQDATTSTYAVLEIRPSGQFELFPADASFNKIELSTIDGTYTRLYYEALRIQAEVIGSSTNSDELEQRVDWVKDASSITFTHSGGDYTVSPTVEQDVFVVVQSDTLKYLNEQLDESD